MDIWIFPCPKFCLSLLFLDHQPRNFHFSLSVSDIPPGFWVAGGAAGVVVVVGGGLEDGEEPGVAGIGAGADTIDEVIKKC